MPRPGVFRAGAAVYPSKIHVKLPAENFFVVLLFCSSMAILLTCRSMMPQGEYTNCYLTRSWRKNCAAVNKE